MSDIKMYAECLNDVLGTPGGNNGSSGLFTGIGGIAPKPCTAFTIEYNHNEDDTNELRLKWADVDDTYRGGVRLVIKKNSAPENYMDGDFLITDIFELDKYKTNPLVIPVTESATYYATLFPFSTTGCVNPLRVNTVSVKVDLPRNFGEYTWEELSEISHGETSIDTLFNIGDTKSFTGVDGNTYTMRIVELESSKGIWVVADELLPFKVDHIAPDCDTNGKWLSKYNESNPMDTIVMNEVIPEDLKPYIRESYQVGHTLSSNGYTNDNNRDSFEAHLIIPDSNTKSTAGTYYYNFIGLGKNNNRTRCITGTDTPVSYVIACAVGEVDGWIEGGKMYISNVDETGRICTASKNDISRAKLASTLYVPFGFYI